MPQTKKKVLIIDDHPILRQGIAQLINREETLIVCGEAEDAATALQLADQHKPDVAVVDISLKDGNGIDLIKDLLVRCPKLLALVLSMHNESFYAERAFRAGARGYITKGEPAGKVVDAIRRILGGDLYISEKLASKLVNSLVGSRDRTDGCLIDRLSDREFEIFSLIGQGLRAGEIAERLHLSVKTIDAHREHIKEKLKIDTAPDLLKYAIQWVQFERKA